MPTVKKKTKPVCVACGGTGLASNGEACQPCLANGKPDKVTYVKRQGQTRGHHCHWPSCGKSVPPAMWGCYSHWTRLPKRLRDAIWATFNPGQEIDWSSSREYLSVANEIQEWIKANGNS